VSPCCFGIEPRADGSIVIAAQDSGQVKVRRFEAARAQVRAVLEFVRERSLSPRVCIAALGAGALPLALAFGEMPAAEVILLRPAALPRADEATSKPVGGDRIAVELARYARRAA
jgi:hypothetical protein